MGQTDIRLFGTSPQFEDVAGSDYRERVGEVPRKELSELGERTGEQRSPYWLRPFENYKTFWPYLVGSYVRVAEELGRYLDLGFITSILDIPPSKPELQQGSVAFERVLEGAGSLEAPAS